MLRLPLLWRVAVRPHHWQQIAWPLAGIQPCPPTPPHPTPPHPPPHPPTPPHNNTIRTSHTLGFSVHRALADGYILDGYQTSTCNAGRGQWGVTGASVETAADGSGVRAALGRDSLEAGGYADARCTRCGLELRPSSHSQAGLVLPPYHPCLQGCWWGCSPAAALAAAARRSATRLAPTQVSPPTCFRLVSASA